MANEIEISIDLAIKQATRDIGKLGKQFDQFEKNTTKALRNSGSAMNTFKGALGALAVSSAFSRIGGSLKNMAGSLFETFVVQGVREAQNLQNALIGLSSVARALGEDVNGMRDAAIALSEDGMIPLEQVSGSLKSLLASGLDGQKAIEVFKALRDSASFNRQGQLSLGEAIQGAADGIKNQNSIMVDNAGVTKNLSVILKEYAVANNTSVAALTESEKRQAIANGIIKEAALFQGDYNRSLETFTAKSTANKTSLQRMQVATGSLITENKGVTLAIGKATEVFQGWTKQINDNQSQIIAFINNGLVKLIDGIGPVIDVVNFFASAFKVAFNSVTIVARTVISSVLAKFRDLAEGVSSIMSFLGQDTSGIDAFVEASKDAIKELKEEIKQDAVDIGDAFGGSEAIAAFKEKAMQAGAAIAAGLAEGKGQIGEAGTSPEDDAKAKKELAALKAAELAKKKELEKALAAEKAVRIKNKQDTFATITTLSDSNNKALAVSGKAFAIRQATIDGFAGVQKALASAPPPFNFILAGLVGAAAAKNVAAIAGVPGFQDGGIVGGNSFSGDNVPARVNSGELILNREQQARLFAQANGGGGGGTVNVNIQGNVIADDDSQVANLIDRISRAVKFDNAQLTASAVA